MRFYQEDQPTRCQSECGPGWAFPVANDDFICRKCDSNCLTCIGELDHCISCD